MIGLEGRARGECADRETTVVAVVCWLYASKASEYERVLDQLLPCTLSNRSLQSHSKTTVIADVHSTTC